MSKPGSRQIHLRQPGRDVRGRTTIRIHATTSRSAGKESVVYLPRPAAPRATEAGALPLSWPICLRAYWSLTKPRIMLLLLITTLARVLAATLLGGALASGGAAALNCYIDRDIDVVMRRTRQRPLPAGILQPRHVLIFGLVLTALAQAVLLRWTTPAAAALSLGAGFLYRAARLLHEEGSGGAWPTFVYSNIYLALIFAAMVVDRLLMPG